MTMLSELHTSGVVAKSYCETEVFNASCPPGSAILMTHAQYGRMNVGRCVKQDYGHVGCFADVIELTDERCSGRPRCDVAIPDRLFARMNPCPNDLKPYLEAGYNCIPGIGGTQLASFLKPKQTSEEKAANSGR